MNFINVTTLIKTKKIENDDTTTKTRHCYKQASTIYFLLYRQNLINNKESSS
jgi:hypothetical protein